MMTYKKPCIGFYYSQMSPLSLVFSFEIFLKPSVSPSSRESYKTISIDRIADGERTRAGDWRAAFIGAAKSNPPAVIMCDRPFCSTGTLAMGDPSRSLAGG
ncbi:Uncharacterised protein [uncultured archaeon]|nr:Uncharacterised protein [uncultured archaeon]